MTYGHITFLASLMSPKVKLPFARSAWWNGIHGIPQRLLGAFQCICSDRTSSSSKQHCWPLLPSVAPNYEPNESKNPPTAAYSSQEVPHRKMQSLQKLDRDTNSVGDTLRSGSYAISRSRTRGDNIFSLVQTKLIREILHKIAHL